MGWPRCSAVGFACPARSSGAKPGDRKRPGRSLELSRSGGVQELERGPHYREFEPRPARCSALPSALTSKSGSRSRRAFGGLTLLQFGKKTKQPQATRLPDVNTQNPPSSQCACGSGAGGGSRGGVSGPRPPRQVCACPDALFQSLWSPWEILELSLSSGTEDGRRQFTFTICFNFLLHFYLFLLILCGGQTGQPVGVGSLHPPCGSGESNSGYLT